MATKPIPQHYLEQIKLLFTQIGYRSPSMLDIAQHLAISKNTLYSFVSNKDELVGYVVQEQLEPYYEKCATIKKEQNVLPQLVLLVKLLGGLYLQFNQKMRTDLQTYYPQSFDLFTSFLASCPGQIIQKNLTKGIKEGIYRSNIHVQLLANYIIQTMELFEADKSTIERVLTQKQFEQIVIEYHLFALVTDKGRELLTDLTA